MRIFLIVIIFTLTIGCTTYSSGDLNGEWECKIDEDIIELWISDTLAIGFNIDNQLMNTYKVDYNRSMLTFNFIDHMEGSAPWKVKILNLSDREFKTELQNPGNKQITVYHRISEGTREISSNDEVNWERYKGYMRTKLDSRL